MACERNGEIEAKDKGGKQSRNKHQSQQDGGHERKLPRTRHGWRAMICRLGEKKKGSAWSAWWTGKPGQGIPDRT